MHWSGYSENDFSVTAGDLQYLLKTLVWALVVGWTLKLFKRQHMFQMKLLLHGMDFTAQNDLILCCFSSSLNFFLLLLILCCFSLSLSILSWFCVVSAHSYQFCSDSVLFQCTTINFILILCCLSVSRSVMFWLMCCLSVPRLILLWSGVASVYPDQFCYDPVLPQCIQINFVLILCCLSVSRSILLWSCVASVYSDPLRCD